MAPQAVEEEMAVSKAQEVMEAVGAMAAAHSAALTAMAAAVATRSTQGSPCSPRTPSLQESHTWLPRLRYGFRTSCCKVQAAR